MQLKVTKLPDRGLVIIYVEGRLDAVSASQLEKAVSENFSEEHPVNLIFDFTHVDYLSSAGLRVLLSTHKLMGRYQRRLVCASFTDEVLEIIKMAGFDRILSVATSLEDANKCLLQQD